MEGINSVKVYSIDEERLKFRVMMSVAGPFASPDAGQYQFQLPPLTAFGNSHEYPSCIINCDVLMAHAPIGTNDAVWNVRAAAGTVFGRAQGLEVRMDVPSSQSIINHQLAAGLAGAGVNQQGGFRQIVPTDMKLIGDGAGGIAGAGSYGWTGEGVGEPLLCGNPFGSDITISLRHPQTDALTYLGSQGAGAGSPDVGLYCFQFTITMVPNSA